ncbi:hypothetical protein BOTBODRAFT_185671 [Botryobasidium botryosum FD-172 SS1]|uniref:FAS1 domain-containing protein n=1 Tax=Botryobasidium botryosum (strain FD-172 SS1) TaxID=930990 RepID=A0A067MS17_BOTB1|nr:hypothetical protein BOTBODRAFT_185671 [Botryobasidium botryosum FD-172 SS1]
MLPLPLLCLTVLSLAATPSLAQQTSNTSAYLTGLIDKLNSVGLRTFAGQLGKLPQDVLHELEQGNKTVFAPSNAAFGDFAPTNLSVPVLEYHIASGAYDAQNIAHAPDHSVIPTLLADPQAVQLGGNRSQVLVVQRSDTTIFVLNQILNVTVLQSDVYQNLIIHTIDARLEIPTSFTSTLNALPQWNLTTFFAQANASGVIPRIEAAHGFTAFVPVEAAFGTGGGALGGASPSTVSTVLNNHIINGTSVYSTSLGTAGSYVSASGEPFSFSKNTSGTYVTSGNTSARILQSDVIAQNGVVHVIDALLFNNQSDPGAASSVYSIATASAQSQTASGSHPTGTGQSSAGAATLGGPNGWATAFSAVGIAVGMALIV